jgi:hypothetical protein
MTALAISLRSFKHPLLVGSILMLLLNDHVLKAAYPSVLTGKLSDFAGLCFFPFLLATGLALLLDRARVPARVTAGLAFGLTLVGFALVKTAPGINAWAAAALSQVLGLPVTLVRDPTDLVALVMLVPAWGVWRRMDQVRPAQPLGKTAYLVVGLASLAALATTPSPPRDVNRLEVIGDKVYANLGNYREDGTLIYPVSSDGIHWDALDPSEVPANVVLQLQQSSQDQLAACDPQNQATCYRIAWIDQVEGSLDGGKTWQVVWQTPYGRLEYMRHYQYELIGWNIGRFNYAAYDLAFLPQKSGTTLVVAMGSEGVLVRSPQGAWERIALWQTAPTPFSGGDLLQVLPGEILVSLLAALWVWTVLSLSVGNILLLRGRQQASRTKKWGLILAWLNLGILALGGVVIFILIFHYLTTGVRSYFIYLPVALIILIIESIFAVVRILRLPVYPDSARRTARIGLLTALGIFPLALLPLVGWAYNVIPLYSTAVGLALLVAAASLVGGGIAIRRLLKKMPLVQPG